MEKILLNGDAIAMLKEALIAQETKHFKVQCNHCTLSIVAENLFYSNTDTIEVALRNVDNSEWIPIERGTDDFPYIDERPVIRNLPLYLFPAMVKQFKKLDEDELDCVWDAYDTLACYR